MDKNLPGECPHCGKKIGKMKRNSSYEYFVMCMNCGACGPNEQTYERAIQMYNLRRPYDSLMKRLKELEDGLRRNVPAAN